MGKVSIDDKKEFIDRLHSYWTLKRDAFNGVSLISMTAINVIRCRVRLWFSAMHAPDFLRICHKEDSDFSDGFFGLITQ
jgi:hypothetical protein